LELDKNHLACFSILEPFFDFKKQQFTEKNHSEQILAWEKS
jgi:hypothetical protein